MLKTIIPGAAVMALACVSHANAALVISDQKTQNVDCVGNICTDIAADAVLNAKDLKTLLRRHDAQIATTALAKDIVFDTKFQWTSRYRLRFEAYGSVTFNFAVTSEGKGGVILNTNDGGAGGDYTFSEKGKLTFWDTSSNLMINGVRYKLVADLPTLASDMQAKPSGVFALSNGYDASVDGVYANSPIAVSFSGKLEGLGHAFSNLSIDDGGGEEYAGLMQELAATGVVRDLRLVGLNLHADHVAAAGGMTGHNLGTLQNVSASGTVNAAVAGGIAGDSRGGTVVNAYSSATVIATAKGGGIVGDVVTRISHSLFDGSVSSAKEAGGIAAVVNGPMTDCRSTGSVTGTGYVGGLVGEISGGAAISASSSTGQITQKTAAKGKRGEATNSTGGLVGYSAQGTIENSYSTATVEGDTFVGGLVGYQKGGQINTSFATGAVSGNGSVGGLAGYNTGSIKQDYAFGAVTLGSDQGYAGGLIGQENGKTAQSYSTGLVTGPSSYLGGLIGVEVPTSTGNKWDYWDLDTSGISNSAQGAGFPANDPGISGLSDVELKSGVPSGFDFAVWRQSPDINGGYPYLLSNPPPQ